MALAATGPADGPSFLDALGVPGPRLPTRRDEAWRFTALERLTARRFSPAPALSAVPDLPAAEELGAEIDRIVILNGRFSAEHSSIGNLPEGAFLGAFADWAARHSAPEVAGGVDIAFAAISERLAGDGFALVLDADVALDRLIHVIHWSEGDDVSIQARSIIRLGRAAGATVIESFFGTGRYWTNEATTVEVGDLARLGHYRLQDEAPQAAHTAHVGVTIGKGGHYDGFVLTLGADLGRHDLKATLAGAHGFCGFSGAYLLDGRRESTVASVIRHAAPNGQTREVWKGCLADRAHGVFQGRIEVAREGQKTDAYQLSKTMLLGDRAVMDAKPELEIFADDVKCSHGATVGDLDETQFFYLLSRGIPPVAARRMLIEAFVVDAIDLVEYRRVRDYFIRALGSRLETIGGAA